ncbi:hypothetical protein ACQUFY_06725 [Robbsia andropogonis]|uniref:hypothetical protein n=1 Tax=Robbsia andropogonis TaxID=28092 RepID=UPI003D241FA9
MDWSDVGKMVGGVLFGGVSWGAAARVWRQIDRVRQAKSEGDTEVVRASLAAEVDTIARYEKLAELAEKRAERAELREAPRPTLFQSQTSRHTITRSMIPDTYTAIPTLGTYISWAGTFRWRCRAARLTSVGAQHPVPHRSRFLRQPIFR